MDIFEICVNEIALEGLDGITIPTLWLRLTEREEKIPFQLDLNLKKVLWEYLLSHQHMEFYMCPIERPMPMIFNRFLGNDEATGKRIATAPDELEIVNDAYSTNLIQCSNQTIKGSCSQYHTRENVTRHIRDQHLSLDTATEKYHKHKLVVVASPKLREEALKSPCLSLEVVHNLTDMEYLVLERIGRSRWQGELQNVLNNEIFKPNKMSHIHYVIKSLLKKGLVVKQNYTYLRPDRRNKIFQQILLHLSCFQRDSRSLFEIRVEMICEILAKSENKCMNVADLRLLLNLKDNSYKRLQEKLVAKGYAEIINDGGKKNCRAIFKTIKLISTPSEMNDLSQAEDEKESQSIADDPQEPEGLVAELPITNQGYRHIQQAGENGCYQADILALLKGYGSLEARNVCRRVNKAGRVRTILVDEGKQRLQKYIAVNFAETSCHTNNLLVEKNRMKHTLETSVASILETTAMEVQDNTLPSLMSPTLQPTTKEEQMDINISENIESFASPVRTSSKWDTHMTTKKMKRKNIILEYVNEHKIVEGIYNLVKMLVEIETKDGSTLKICKKTLVRLIMNMSNNGFLKYLCIPISSNGLVQEVEFLMSIDCDPARLKEAIQQVQFRMYSQNNKSKLQEKTKEILEIKKDFAKKNYIAPIANSSVNYGYGAKFQRFQAVHMFLWYLAYGHPNQYEDTENVDIDNNRVYVENNTWKRWVPPIPQDRRYGEGWIQLGAAAVVLPLSILTQFYKISYEINGVEDFLQDQVQRHSLVRHLPHKLKQLLLYKRKYMYSLAAVLEYLCFMGLTSIDQQKFQENTCLPKEEQMIYIHKRATITDTRTSDKGYTEVSEQNYKKIDFYFDDYETVEQYWFKLRDVCLMTQLGLKRPTAIDIDCHRYKQQLKKFVSEHISRKDPQIVEDGSQRGDGKGAGGLDSTLFPHMYKNWFNNAKIRSNKAERLPKLVDSQLKLEEQQMKKKFKLNKQDNHSDTSLHKKKPEKRKRSSIGAGNDKRKKVDTSEIVNGKSYEVLIENNIGRTERVKGGKGKKRHSRTPVKKFKKVKANNQHGSIGKYKLKYSDKVDLKALGNMMGRCRARFSGLEDSMLVVCRIASTILHKSVKVSYKRVKQHAVAWSVVRDSLHHHFPSLANNKTSYSCGRRVLNLFKNPSTRLYHDLTVTDVMGDKNFLSQFITRQDYNEEELEKVYVELVDALMEKFEQKPGVLLSEICDDRKTLENVYTIKSFSKKLAVDEVHIVPRLTEASQIEKCVLENLLYIMLSVNEEFDKCQAYKIFESYREPIINEVWNKFKLAGNVAKAHSSFNPTRKRVLPYGVSTYHFSQAHFYSFRVVEEVYKKVNQVFKVLNSDKKYFCGDENNTTSSSVISLAMLLLASPENISVDVVLSNLISHRTEFKASLEAKLRLGVKDKLQKIEENNPENTLFADVTLKHAQSQIELISSTRKRGEKYFYDAHDIDRTLQCHVNEFQAKLLPIKEADVNADAILKLNENLVDFDEVIMRKVITVIDNAGPIGIAISDIKDSLLKQYKDNISVFQNHQKYLDMLIENSEAYYVGMYERRIVLKKHSKNWFIWSSKVVDEPKEVEKMELDSEGSNKVVEEVKPTTESDDLNNTKTPKKKPPKTEAIRFLCRPWHNVHGGVNYRTVKLLLFGVFLHIFWNPGVTMTSLNERFITSIQRITLLDILDRLINMKLITKYHQSKTCSWQLFSDVDSNSDSDFDEEYFEPTPDAMLYASRLNEILNDRMK